ncbi:zinc finger MYM-type protein 1-like [Metopolophium dirhodum]|uniref:zinc finger MYM-type protein 1-like n=1 Tax=Metopolophium dirhodum TaxID=44670 RepID=UPI0029905D97|nr:zinc finger MYM-type protein 1-like [Metopolophium dirhodum]
MAGKFNGVQAKIQNKYSCAVYTHCMAHRVNLVVVDMCKFVKETKCLFNTLDSLYVHFSYPTKNQRLIDMQKKLGLKIKTIGRMSDTRWNCWYKNCDAILDCYQAIIHVLQEEIENENDKDVNEAIGILTNLQKGSFIVNLFVIRQVLSTINILSNMMQDKNATLGKSSVIIKKFTDDNNILIDIPHQARDSKRKRREPNNLNDFIVTTTTSAIYELIESNKSVEDYYRTNIYFKILDSIIENLKRRFSPESLSLAISVDKFMQLNYEGSLVFINYYKDLLDINKLNIKSEMTVARNCINKINNDFNIDDLKITIKKEIFPNIYKMLQVALTLPVSSATCERSFSAMRRIKTLVRTSMHQERFTNLSILHIEKDVTKNIDTECILNELSKSSRMMVLK